MATYEERLNQIRNLEQNTFVERACKTCKRITRFHCTFCEDTDSCITCHKRIINEFKMHRLWFELRDASAEDDLRHINPIEARSLAIQRCITSLQHVSHCRDDNCFQPSCQKMKRLVSHAKTCKRRGKGCTVCENVIALFCYHGKFCYNRGCTVPFCSDVNYEIRQLKIVQGRFLRRHERFVRLRQRQAIRESRPTNQPSSDATPFASQHVPQPGSGMEPSAVDTLQAVQQQLSNLDLNNMFTNSVFSHPDIVSQLQNPRIRELGPPELGSFDTRRAVKMITAHGLSQKL